MMMGFMLGIATILAILIGLPLTLYAIAIGGKKVGAGSGKLLPLIAGIVTVIGAWWYYDSTLLLATIIFIAGGTALLLWSDAPDIMKTIGGFMVGGGALLGLILLLVGPSAVEHRKNQLTAVVGGQAAPPPPPLSPTEQAKRLERERQEAEVVAIREAERAASEEMARIARGRAFEESLTPAQQGPCLRRYTDQLNCVTVVFGQHTKYEREALKDHCIVSDPVSALERTNIGGDQYRFTGRAGLTAQFFDLPVGQSIGSFTCGK